MVGILLLLQLAYVYLPFMNRWFGSYPLSFGQWVLSAILALGVFFLVELEKVIFRKRM